MKTRFNVANNLSDSVVGGNGLKPKYRRAVVLFTLYTVAAFLIVFQDCLLCINIPRRLRARSMVLWNYTLEHTLSLLFLFKAWTITALYGFLSFVAFSNIFFFLVPLTEADYSPLFFASLAYAVSSGFSDFLNILSSSCLPNNSNIAFEFLTTVIAS